MGQLRDRMEQDLKLLRRDRRAGRVPKVGSPSLELTHATRHIPQDLLEPF
jgi:hypothetical protein